MARRETNVETLGQIKAPRNQLVLGGFVSRSNGSQDQSMALKLNSPPSLIPENQRDVTVLVRV